MSQLICLGPGSCCLYEIWIAHEMLSFAVQTRFHLMLQRKGSSVNSNNIQTTLTHGHPLNYFRFPLPFHMKTGRVIQKATYFIID